MDIEIRKDGLFDGFDDPIFKERNGKKAMWIDKVLHTKIMQYAERKNKNPQTVVEYFLNLAVHSATNGKQPNKLFFEVEKL